jgi:hypothetical protein
VGRLDRLTNPEWANRGDGPGGIRAETLGQACVVVAAALAIFPAVSLVLAVNVTVATVPGLLQISAATDQPLPLAPLLRILATDLGDLISLAGLAMVALGGYRLMRRNPSGKTSVVLGLILWVAGGILGGVSAASLTSLALGAGLVGFRVVAAAAAYYVVMAGRFEGLDQDQ